MTAGLLHDLADQKVPNGYEIVTYPASTTVTKDGFTIPVIVKSTNAGGEVNPNPTPQGEVTIIYKDADGNEVGRATISGVEGSTVDPSDTINSNVPAGYKIKADYDVPNSASVSSTITVPVVKADNGDDNHGNGGNHGSGTGVNSGSISGTGVNSAGVNGIGTNGTGVNSTNAAKHLPQTGTSQNATGIFGLALAAIAGLFGFASDRKRKN